MAVQLIQASTIKSSFQPIELQQNCHLAKVKGKYYLVKIKIIEIDYKQKNKINERNNKKRANTA